MRGEFACRGFDYSVAQRGEVEAVEQAFAAAEQDRGKGEVELVDQTGLQVLTDRGDAPADLDVLTSRRLPSLV